MNTLLVSYELHSNESEYEPFYATLRVNKDVGPMGLLGVMQRSLTADPITCLPIS